MNNSSHQWRCVTRRESSALVRERRAFLHAFAPRDYKSRDREIIANVMRQWGWGMRYATLLYYISSSAAYPAPPFLLLQNAKPWKLFFRLNTTSLNSLNKYVTPVTPGICARRFCLQLRRLRTIWNLTCYFFISTWRANYLTNFVVTFLNLNLNRKASFVLIRKSAVTFIINISEIMNLLYHYMYVKKKKTS